MASVDYLMKDGIEYMISESDYDARGEQRIVITENPHDSKYFNKWGIWTGNRQVWIVNYFKKDAHRIYKTVLWNGSSGTEFLIEMGLGIIDVQEVSKMINGGLFDR